MNIIAPAPSIIKCLSHHRKKKKKKTGLKRPKESGYEVILTVKRAIDTPE